MRAVFAGLMVLALPGVAHADKKLTPTEAISEALAHVVISTMDGPDFYFSEYGIKEQGISGVMYGTTFYSTKRVKLHVAFSAKPTIAWVAADVQLLWGCTDHVSPDMMGDVMVCPKDPKEVVEDNGPARLMGTLHATCLVQQIKTEWKPRACHFGTPVTLAQQTKLVKQATLAKIAPSTAGAEEVVKVFESTIGDPKAFAKTISDRADVLLYGSGATERTVGGAAVAKQLASWGLAMKRRDGIDAALVGPNVAWVAANVDASTTKFKSPYRVLAIYEKTGTAWKIVQLHFSFPTPTLP